MDNPSFRVLGTSPTPLPAACLVDHCAGLPVPDAPIALCLDHIRAAFGYYLRRAEDDHSAKVERDPYEADKTNGWVYFIRFGDLVKIGWSRTPENRFNVLQPDAVLHHQPGTRQDEARLHAAFAHLLEPDHGREYFRAEPDLIAFINALHAGS